MIGSSNASIHKQYRTGDEEDDEEETVERLDIGNNNQQQQQQQLGTSKSSRFKKKPRSSNSKLWKTSGEKIGFDSLGTTTVETSSDDQDVWKEHAFKPEDSQEVIVYLRQVIQDNEDDLNFPGILLDKATEALQEGVPFQDIFDIATAIKAELTLAQENSPYPEVRACVDAFDDPTTPVLTFRMWSIGLMLVVLGTALNQFFAPRMPGIGLSVTFAQLVSYPIGCMMAKFLPTRVFRFGKRSFTFNPGPFNMKEHMLISIMANVSFGGAYATDIIAVLRIDRFYNNAALAQSIGFQVTLVLSTQMIGYTLAGLTRKFLVYPQTMVWWGNLLEISILRALHSKDNNQPANGWKISQMRFFFICATAYGVYYLLPGVFFQSLSFFNWTTWISPNNVKLALITGTVGGLGLNPIPTLDWNFMSIDPIVTPLWSIINIYCGALLAFLIICVVYFKNIAFTSYLPINSNRIFDRTGNPYNASMVLDSRGILDQAKYEAYSPPYMAASSIVLYTAFFALYTSTMVHAALHYHKHIRAGFSHFFSSSSSSSRNNFLFLNKIKQKSNIFGVKQSEKNKCNKEDKIYDDVHYRLMQAYPEVPEWWFMIIGVISIALAIFMIEYYDTQMPIWGLAFAFALALILIVPTGIMGAVASVSASLNVLSELVGGYALAGRPLGNMLFKTYGYITTAQALGYAADLKLAHYVKIPPRATFAAQTVGTVLSSLISVAVLDWQIGRFTDLCSPTQPLHFTCPGYNSFFSSSIIWGAVGPHRLFTRPGALYRLCMWGFLIGFVVPFIPWLAMKKWPRSSWRLVHTPVIIAGFLIFSPQNLGYYTPAVPLALFFQRYVKKRYTAWYEKYALTLTAAIGSGVAIFGLLYFFLFQMNGQNYSWAGNNIHQMGCDGQGCSLQQAPQGGFGPDSWH